MRAVVPTAEAGAERRLRVLLVEDNPADAELSLLELKRAGFEVSADIVESPEEFSQHVLANPYDVILADYSLPNWTGLAAVEQLQQKGKDIPVILVTGFLGEEAAVECIKKGAADYVLKDRLSRLPLVVRRALEDSHLRAERRQAEAERARLMAAVEQAAEVVIITDVEGTIEYVNPAFTWTTGYTREEVLGQNPRILKSGQHDETYYRVMWQTIRAGRVWGGEMINRRKDGRLYTEEGTITPVRNERGEICHFIGVMADISGRKRADAALRTSEANLARAQRIAHLGSWEWNIANNALLWSDETYRLFGLIPQAFGMTYEGFLNCVQPDDRELVKTAMKEALSRRKPYRIDHRIVLPDGSERVMHEHAEVTFDDTGRPIYMVGTVQDITEQRRLEDQLRQAQKMDAVGRLAGGVAHDFNNMLNVIVGYTELLLDVYRSNDTTRKRLEEIKKAGKRATQLTRQLLAFSRKQVLQPKVLDLNAVVADMVNMLQRLIGEDISLVTVPVPELGRVKADAVGIEQILLNLAVNARDAMPRGGKLVIETANVELDEAYARLHPSVRPGSYVMLIVSDTGRGMDKQTQARVFEPFFTTKEKGEGTGLGLSTVYGIVKQSSGYIWVSSEPGHGTTFKIYLPQIEEAVEVAGSEKIQTRSVSGSETVLVVEDAEPLRKLACELLETSGYTVLEACDGAEAIEIAERHTSPIHLLMTDVVMPGISGPELARRLTSRRPEMKVLYMSGYTDEAIVRHGILVPGVAFLQKPFMHEALASKVHEVLEGGRRPVGAVRQS